MDAEEDTSGYQDWGNAFVRCPSSSSTPACFLEILKKMAIFHVLMVLVVVDGASAGGMSGFLRRQGRVFLSFQVHGFTQMPTQPGLILSTNMVWPSLFENCFSAGLLGLDERISILTEL